MRVSLHCTWAFLLVLALPAHAQQPPAPGPTAYSIFLRGAAVGTENVTVQTDATGTTITSEGRLAPPLNITLRKAEVRYTPDWTTTSFAAEGSFNGAETTIRTTFANGTATTQGTQGAVPIARAQPVAANTVVLPNFMFGAYAALARRLATDKPGVDLKVYIVPQVEVGVRVTAVHQEQTQVGTSIFPVRRYELVFMQPTGDLAVTLTATTDGSLVRLTVPAQALDVVRSDVASPIARSQVYANPGDQAVIIPTEQGFNLGATITRPKNVTSTAKLAAVLLLAGSGANDRDGTAFGVPTIGQIAGAVADAGFIAVRYDKRGYGQSGGRSESATLSDLADDARAVVKWLGTQNDVDAKRIAVVGHSEGAMVGLIAASRDRRIGAVVSIAGPATTGVDLLLEQQQAAFNAADIPQADRNEKIALQKQIQQAVLTGKGWEGIPPPLRREADTPWFQSVLAYDPAKVLDDVRQPLLIVHGALDRQVPVDHADKLAALARQESKSKTIDVVVVRGVNHLLVPAVTGELNEYGTLTDRNVSKDVTMAIITWLQRTLPAATR